MRKVKLSGEEANLVFSALDNGDPQRGLSLAEIRKVMPVLDMLEAKAQKVPVPGGERLVFPDGIELVLKESEFTVVTAKLESSSGWMTASIGRKVIQLLDRLKEIPAEPDGDKKE